MERCQAQLILEGTTHSFSFRGHITVPLTLCNTSLDIAIFVIKKNFSIEAG
jgi:hypothetical protein